MLRGARVMLQKTSKGFTLIELMVVITIMVILMSMFVGLSYMRSRARAQYMSCTENLRSIATGLAMYATEHGGRYPESIDSLTPNYIHAIPTCPAAGADTYSETYTYSTNPDDFTINCNGSYHGIVGIQTGFPQYTSSFGLIEY